MAVLTPLWTQSPTSDPATIRAFLKARGVEFERWELPASAQAIAAKASVSDEDKQTLLRLFADKLAEKALRQGYQAADVVVIRPHLPGVDLALAKFDRVHFHDDDEVRDSRVPSGSTPGWRRGRANRVRTFGVSRRRTSRKHGAVGPFRSRPS